MIDPLATTHGLPTCLRIPIAATGVEAIKRYVGEVLDAIEGFAIGPDKVRVRRVNAVLVRSYTREVERNLQVKLWQLPNAASLEDRLFPQRQVWVHVNYRGYRQACHKFGLSIPAKYFLDHVQNREAVRLRFKICQAAQERGYTILAYSHPYLRLCPVKPEVNTSGGVNQGGEGLEKDYLQSMLDDLTRGVLSPVVMHGLLGAMTSQIVYADPMDITKMLDVEPGTFVLPGVRDTQALLFPS